MQMCKDMTSAITKTASMAAFSTPELHALFSEWLESRQKEAFKVIAKPGKHDLESVAKALKLTLESTAHLLLQMAAEKKLDLEVKSIGTMTQKKSSRKKKKGKKSA